MRAAVANVLDRMFPPVVIQGPEDVETAAATHKLCYRAGQRSVIDSLLYSLKQK